MTDEQQSRLNEEAHSPHDLRGCPAFDLLSALADGELAEPELSVVRAHVESCAECTRALDDIALLTGALRRSTPPASSRSFLLTETDVTAARSRAEPTPLAPRRSRLVPFYPAMTALAALLLVVLLTGDLLFGGESAPSDAPPRDTIVIDGTPFAPTDEEMAPSFGAASADNMGDDQTGSTQQSAVDTDPFWDAWRYAQVAVAILFVAFAALWLFRGRSSRR